VGSQNRSGRRGVEIILPLSGLELRFFGPPARSQSLNGLPYAGSFAVRKELKFYTLYFFHALLQMNALKHCSHYIHILPAFSLKSLRLANRMRAGAWFDSQN
jgi:hypothetical protein